MADKPKKKKSPPKTPFEKIGAAYESEARRQEKAGNQDMAKKTRQAAAKSMTPDNKKALEESAQASKDKKGKKSKTTKGKTDAVEAAGAKAKNAVDAAVERNPVSSPTGKTTRRALPAGYGDYQSSRGKDAETQRATDREFDRLEAEDKEKDKPAIKGDKQGPPSPAGSKDNTGSGPSTQRTPKPSTKDKPADRPNFGSVKEQREKNPPPNSAYPNFGSVKEQREKNPPPNSAYPNFGSVAEQRAKAGPVQPSKLRAGAEGTSGKSGPAFRQNDITTEMPETRREKDEARTARIKELASSGANTDPSDKGEMPSAPPSTRPTVLVTPTKDGKMPEADKPGFMSRLRSRMSSFSSRPGAPAAPAAPVTPATPPSGGGSAPATPTPENVTSGYGDYTGGDDNSVGRRASTGGGDITGANKAGRDQSIGNTHNQKINAGFGPVTATTSGKATGSGKGGVTASTSGTAKSHPRAQNASRGGRPTSKKK